MSRTILFTLGKKPVLAPPVVLVQKITVMKTSITTLKTKVASVRVQNLQAMTDANETPTTKLSDYKGTLEVGKVESVEENEVIPKDDSKNYEETLKALMANRDGLQKTVTLLLKIVEKAYTIDSSAEADVEHILEKAEGVDALANCLYGAEMKRTVILDLAAELYRYVGFEFKIIAEPTTEELATITSVISELNTQIVAISKVILEVQTLVIRHVGAKFDPKTLVIQVVSVAVDNYGEVISPEITVVEETSTSTTVLSAAQIEANLAKEVTSIKQVLKDIVIINTMLVNIQSGALTTGGSGEETAASVVVSYLIDIVVLITEEQFTSDAFTTLLAKLQAVTKVAEMTLVEQDTIESLIQIVALVESTKTGAAAGASQGLIGAKGLMVEEISTDLSFEEQAAKADAQLQTNRANCKGMDDVAKALKAKQAELTPVCNDKFDDDCDVDEAAAEASSTLIEKILFLTKTSSANIEDASIVTMATEILTQITSITVITLEQSNMISAQVLTIQSTVLIYVSQISIVESKKFEVGGAITFPGAPAAADENDPAAQKEVLKAQLSNLMICGDANDRVIECITKIEQLPEAESPAIDDNLQGEAEKVPAMCSAPEPPVEEVQQTSASIVGLCQNLEFRPAPGQLKSLTFIKQSLLTFKQTFTEQITTFSQKMSDITGESVTAFSLGIQVISDTGALTAAEEVDITGGLEVTSVEFYKQRYEIVQSSISTLSLVMTKVTEVTSISTDAEGGMSALDFALLVADLSTELTSGIITQKVIDLSVKILKAEVTSTPSNAVLIMLEKASTTVSKLQISLLSEVVVIKQQLVMKLTELKISITTITFEIQQVSSTGEITMITEAASASQESASFAELSTLSTTMVESRKTLENVNVLLTSLTKLDFSSITGTEVISITIFMQKISQFMVLIGQGFASAEIQTIGLELLSYKIEAISEAYITQLTFMMSTIVTYSVQVTIEVTMISSQMSTVEGGFVEEITTESLVLLNQVKSDFESFSLLLETAKGSTNTAASTTAAAFLQISLKFVILIEQSVTVGFASIATQINSQIIEIQTLSTSVTPFSGKLILLMDGMVTSINIYMVVLEQLIVIPGETTPAATKEPEEGEVSEGPVQGGGGPDGTAAPTEPGASDGPVITEGPVIEPGATTTAFEATTAAVDCDSYSMDYFSERNNMYNNSIKNLQDMKSSISSAMEGTFSPSEDCLEKQSVDSSEYMKSLISIVGDLSIDMTNIDAERVSTFMCQSVDGSFTDQQMESLTSYGATIDSYISQLAVEIAMGYSFMQDLQMMDANDGSGQEGAMEAEEEDRESLTEKEEMMVENIANLNQAMEHMMNIENNCNSGNENSPMDYYTFVIDQFYLPLISTDMMDMGSLWGSVEFGPLGFFELYNNQGVQCMGETQQRDLMAVQVVLKVYIEMCQLHLAIIREEMLETTGECPAGFEIGDWSDDSGECCCDPNNQPEPEPLTEDGEEPIEIPIGGYGEEPIEIGGYGDGEEPVEITAGGDGEEPIEIPFGDGEEPIEIGGYGDGEEPVLIPSGDGEEPVEIPQGDGEEPIEITGGEEPVVIGGGEEPVTITSGEEPVSLGGGQSPVTIGNGNTMLSSSTTTRIPTGSRRRGRRDDPMSTTTTVGPTGQSPVSMSNGYGDGEEPVTVGYGGGEEPVTLGDGYGGEEPVTIGDGYGGEEPITIDGGEEPVTIGDGYGYGDGQEPVEVTTGFTGEQPMELTGYGEATVEVEVTFGPVPTPERPDERPAEKCFPKKKFCKCRSSSTSRPTGSGPIDFVVTTPTPRPSDRPTAGPGTSPSGPPPTGTGPVPTGPEETTIFTIPTSTPVIPSLSTSTLNIPITSPIPSTSDTATTSSGEMGLIPHLLSSVTPPTASPSSLAPTGPTGEIPHLLGSSTEETTMSTVPNSTPNLSTQTSSASFIPSLSTSTNNIPITSYPYPLTSSSQSTTSETATTSPGTTPAPLTSQLPFLLTRSTTGPSGSSTMHMGSVPYLLQKTTPSTMASTMSTTTFEGMMPYKLVRSSTPTTSTVA